MSDPNNQLCALNHLPPDLVEAILPFLPVKSLGRFKSVSKQWYSLISSPNFIKTHILNYIENNPNPNPTHLVLFPHERDSLYSLDIKQLNTQITPATQTAKNLNFQEPGRWSLGSCNGLLLVYYRSTLRLVNPTTGKTFKLPYIGGGGGVYNACGFGYDSSTDDYKVIFFYRTSVHPESHFVSAYSLRNKSCSMLSNCFYKDYDFDHEQGVLVNNILHWVVRNIRHLKTTIFSFSLATEEFHEIELPDFYKCSHDYFKIFGVFALGEKLVIVFKDHYKYFYEMWVMEEYGVPKSWTKLCIFANDMDVKV
ncbi:F-box/kelch-repeat protein At3g06240-like [Rutidosis leptorrhynchoides]|uniref:F-box/kelch-repeat protein At3g06240-like n=1 Tax=Rutidosis leptorrhynchoides TaxID=125765 RepID=UPI003A99044F